MSIKKIILQQLMSDRENLRIKHTYIIKKPYVLLPVAAEEPAQRSLPIRLKQLRSRSQNAHPSKNITLTERKPVSIENSPRTEFAIRRKNYKTEQKRGEKSQKPTNMNEQIIRQYNSSQLKLPSGNQKQINNSMKEYLKFIRAMPQQNYEISANFSHLRKRHRREPLKGKEKNIFDFIRRLFGSMYEKISTKEGNSKEIFDLCHMYFACFEKVKIEIILSIYYPSNLHEKIRSFLIYQRLIVFLLSALSVDKEIQTLTRIQIQSIKLVVQLLIESYGILFEPIKQQEEQAVTSINETFRMLKSIGETEKRLQIIQKQLRKMYSNGQKAILRDNKVYGKLSKSKDQWPLELLTQKEMNISWSYLKIPPVPYLPPKNLSRPFTLVMQLDHTLIFYDKETKILKYRPYLDLFLHRAQQYFEIVVFSKAEHKYTEVLVGQIERKNRFFSYILSQQHLSNSQDDRLLKDVSRLGRQLSEVVIIDHLPSIYRKYELNGLAIPSWHGDKSDKQLEKASKTLQDLISSNTMDVRQYFRCFTQGNINQDGQ